MFSSVSADDSRTCTRWIYSSFLTHHQCIAAEHGGIHSATATSTAAAASAAATATTAAEAIPTFPKPDWQCFRVPKYVDSVAMRTLSER